MTLAQSLLEQACCGDPALETEAHLVFHLHARARRIPGRRPTLTEVARNPAAEVVRQKGALDAMSLPWQM